MSEILAYAIKGSNNEKVDIILFYSITFIPLGTHEEAKACEYREP